MYLTLFHGRHSPDEDLEDWGFTGPTLGPLDSVNCTYGNLRLFFQDNPDIECDLIFLDDLVYYNGDYYGDFSLTNKPWSKHGYDIHTHKAYDRWLRLELLESGVK